MIVLAIVLGIDWKPPLLDRSVVLFYLLAFLIYFVTYQVLTWWVFHRAEPPELNLWIRSSTPHGRAAKRQQKLAGGSGPSWAVQAAVLGLAAVLVIAFRADLRQDLAVLCTGTAVVIVSWSMVAVAYAVEYLRENSEHPGLVFPGDSQLAFWDYLYLACQVSTTFSSSDVEITTTRMRRRITGHSVVAFAFNSIIVAMLVSAVLVVTK